MDEKLLKIKFGQVIKNLRVSKKLTQEKFAEISGLHRTYITEVERGERNVSLINIVNLANALQVKPSEIFELMEKSNESI